MSALLRAELKGRRRPGKITPRASLNPEALFEERDVGSLVTISSGSMPADDWFQHYRGELEDLLIGRGAVLVRGFPSLSESTFSRIVRCFGPAMRYVYRSTPRREVGPGVYTSTEYPASEHIPLHNENAYAAQWPRLVLFHCVRAAETGGETPLADSAAVHEAIHPGVRETFVSRGLSYIRNFGTDLDLDWREAFQTQEKEVVEAYCKDAGITCEWLSPRHLRTRQVCPAVRAHPVTGKLLWFNQAHLFHHSSLAPEIAHELLSLFGEDGLPRTVRYGDGSLIEAEALAEVARAYASEERAFSWEDGDVLLLDNMRCAHGRRPFAGNRRVLAGLVAATVQGN